MKTVKLLDGNHWDKEKLLEKMVDDNFYYGDLNKLALSSSSLKLLLDSPKSYYYINKYGNEQTAALRSGWLLHCAVLEPEKYDKLKFIPVKSKNTKAYKLAVEEYGQVFTQTEKDETERLVDALLKNPQAISLLSDSQTEVAGIHEDIFGMPFRGKADILKNKGGIIDLKTTVDVQNFDKSAYRFRYYLQVYIYCQIFGCDYKDFTFLCISKNTLDVGVWNVSKDFYEYGKKEVERAVKLYKTFFIEDFDLNDYTITGTI